MLVVKMTVCEPILKQDEAQLLAQVRLLELDHQHVLAKMGLVLE